MYRRVISQKNLQKLFKNEGEKNSKNASEMASFDSNELYSNIQKLNQNVDDHLRDICSYRRKIKGDINGQIKVPEETLNKNWVTSIINQYNDLQNNEIKKETYDIDQINYEQLASNSPLKYKKALSALSAFSNNEYEFKDSHSLMFYNENGDILQSQQNFEDLELSDKQEYNQQENSQMLRMLEIMSLEDNYNYDEKKKEMELINSFEIMDMNLQNKDDMKDSFEISMICQQNEDLRNQNINIDEQNDIFRISDDHQIEKQDKQIVEQFSTKLEAGQETIKFEDLTQSVEQQSVKDEINCQEDKNEQKYFSLQLVRKINSKKIKKGKNSIKKMESKNCCRHLISKTIKVMKDGLFQDKVNELCNHDQQTQSELIEYFAKNKYMQEHFFSGPESIKEFFMTAKDQKEEKLAEIFRKFTQWFLEKKALRFILKGQMKDKLNYIRYKNQILLSLFSSKKIKNI